MVALTQASRELFRRSPDERYANLAELWQRCWEDAGSSKEEWLSPKEFRVESEEGRLHLAAGAEKLLPNDWSFGQLCKLMSGA